MIYFLQIIKKFIPKELSQIIEKYKIKKKINLSYKNNCESCQKLCKKKLNNNFNSINRVNNNSRFHM